MNATSGTPVQGAEGAGCGPSPRWGWILVAILALVVAIGALFALLIHAGVIAGPPYGATAPPFWPIFPIGFVLVWIVVLVTIRPWGWRGGWRGAYGWGYDDDPRRIVHLRYARGEISREQMVRILQDLSEA